MPPTIQTRTPAPGATGVAPTANVVVQFSEDMQPLSGATFFLRRSGTTEDVAATVSTVGATATLDPTSDLAFNQAYDVTVMGTVTDLALNPLGADATWSFTVAGPSFTDTTYADFSAALASTCEVGSHETGGDVLLPPTVGSGFDGTALPRGWAATPWTTGGAATVGGGLLTVDGVRADGGATLYSPGRVLEFVATFGAETFQAAGLANTLVEGQSWAFFGTGNTTNTLYARTSNGTQSNDFVIPGSWIGTPHRYRIEWDATEVRYYIDGALRLTSRSPSPPTCVPSSATSSRAAPRSPSTGSA